VKTTLIDSPVANLANIARALRASGAEVEITSDATTIASSEKVVLPGVGAFAAARKWLEESGVDQALLRAVRRGASLLGICVGHQLLFDGSNEMGRTAGLGIVRGEIDAFQGPLPVPQIGWNRVTARGRLFEGVEQEAFYFVNSYAARNVESESATAQYNGPFTAAIEQDRVFGVQFHPEKSSAAGLRVLRNFVACR
jgi:glutamine amidotransferase